MSGLTAVCLLLMEVTGNNESFDQKSSLFLAFTVLAPFIVWWMGISAKKQLLGNKLTYKQGILEGFKISLVFAITSPFVFVAYYLLFNYEILNYVRSSYMLSEDTSDTIVILIDVVAQFISAIVFGTIYAAVISFFLKSKD